jgi:hypothetical protein
MVEEFLEWQTEMSNANQIQIDSPECELHAYPAGHGFKCYFDAKSSALALGRSLKWLERHGQTSS